MIKQGYTKTPLVFVPWKGGCPLYPLEIEINHCIFLSFLRQWDTSQTARFSRGCDVSHCQNLNFPARFLANAPPRLIGGDIKPIGGDIKPKKQGNYCLKRNYQFQVDWWLCKIFGFFRIFEKSSFPLVGIGVFDDFFAHFSGALSLYLYLRDKCKSVEFAWKPLFICFW